MTKQENNYKRTITCYIFIIMSFISLLGYVTATKQFNGWDIGYNSEYYKDYVTSESIKEVPVYIDFTKRKETFEFIIDNINDKGIPTYKRISDDINKSKATIHLVGDANNNAKIISPEDYDPRIPYAINYNNERRVVVDFYIPEDHTDKDVYSLGLRVQTLENEQKQLMLKLHSVKEKPSNGTNNFLGILLVSGIVFVTVMLLYFLFFRKKGVKKNDF